MRNKHPRTKGSNNVSGYKRLADIAVKTKSFTSNEFILDKAFAYYGLNPLYCYLKKLNPEGKSDDTLYYYLPLATLTYVRTIATYINRAMNITPSIEQIVAFSIGQFLLMPHMLNTLITSKPLGVNKIRHNTTKKQIDKIFRVRKVPHNPLLPFFKEHDINQNAAISTILIIVGTSVEHVIGTMPPSIIVPDASVHFSMPQFSRLYKSFKANEFFERVKSQFLSEG